MLGSRGVRPDSAPWAGRALQAWVLLAGNAQNGSCGWAVDAAGVGAAECGQAPGQTGQTGADRAYCTGPWGRAVQGGAMTDASSQLVMDCGTRAGLAAQESLGGNPRGEATPGSLIWGCLLVSGIQARPLVSSRMGFPPCL